MLFRTYERLSPQQINTGLKQVIKDGLASEAMSCLTEGAFLVALALQLGASNFQIGLIAALPTFTNVFQLAAIRLVQRYQSRKAITVLCLLLARLPLFLVAGLPFLFSKATALQVLIGLMFIHYFFGSIAGASWNSWVKDIVPRPQLGRYFSKRSRLTQTLNVSLSLTLAFILNYLSTNHAAFMPNILPLFFVLGGVASMISVYELSRAPEPMSHQVKQNLWKQFTDTLRDKNFRNLLVFNSFWIFAFNLAAPFFSVYMMRTMGLPISSILFLNVLAQLSSIVSIRIWGKYADKYSNKNIIRICAPLYIICLFGWAVTVSASSTMATWIALLTIHIVTGVSAAGINLSLTNIGLKLAPHKDAMMYLAAKNMITGLFSAAAPLTGGFIADFFAGNKQALHSVIRSTPAGKATDLLNTQHWNFFFITGAVLCLLSLQLLKLVKEDGEISQKAIITRMRYDFKDATVKILQSTIMYRKMVPSNVRKHLYKMILLGKHLTAKKERA